MRNVLAVLLAVLAALAGASAWGGSVANRALTQPSVVQEQFGPMIDQPAVRSMVATRVNAQLIQALPGGVVQEKLKEPVKKASEKVTNAVLDDPEVRAAWLRSLDATRAQYVQRVREEGGSAGRVEVVLDPLSDLVAGHITDALKTLGVKDAPTVHTSWRLDNNIGQAVPVAGLAVPVMQLVVTQSEHWPMYALAGLVLFALALLVASRRVVPFVAAGFVGLLAGAVGVASGGILGGAGGGLNNAVMSLALKGMGEEITATSIPVVIGGGVLLVVAIVMAVIGRSRRNRASLDWEA